MTIAYIHASKFGNGAAVAARFRDAMVAKGIAVDVAHVRDADPDAHRGEHGQVAARAADHD